MSIVSSFGAEAPQIYPLCFGFALTMTSWRLVENHLLGSAKATRGKGAFSTTKMKVKLNESTQLHDLDEAVRDNPGNFIVQQGNQTYLVAADVDQKPVCRSINPTPLQLPTGDFTITKISDHIHHEWGSGSARTAGR